MKIEPVEHEYSETLIKPHHIDGIKIVRHEKTINLFVSVFSHSDLNEGKNKSKPKSFSSISSRAIFYMFTHDNVLYFMLINEMLSFISDINSISHTILGGSIYFRKL